MENQIQPDNVESESSGNNNCVINIYIPKGKAPDKADEIKKEKFKKLEECKSSVTQINISNAGSFLNSINEQTTFEKLTDVCIENSEIPFTLFDTMPNLSSFTMKACPLIPIDIIDCLKNNKIKILNLEKNNYVNQDLNNIIKGYLTEKIFIDNLESISFAGNNITKADLSLIPSQVVYPNLKKINFKKNKIFKFIYNPDNFPNLKFINCCKNNFNKSFLGDIKNIGSLESGNDFLFDPELSQNYYDNLKKKLKNNENDYYLTDYLNITYIPKVDSLVYFSDFIINEKIISQLRKLDLSYNSLNCETFFKFVGQNTKFKSLITLNLNGNELDDTFFEKLLN